MSWVRVLGPRPAELDEDEESLGSPYVDAPATAKTGMYPTVQMVGIKHIVHGADCGVPCSTEAAIA
ncbi:hypothetical protein F4782DRAFT_519414 [Xylaria castorea]|nr:hypothetical protein F4782DRAFT_519414 [Xylaria castorea]